MTIEEIITEIKKQPSNALSEILDYGTAELQQRKKKEINKAIEDFKAAAHRLCSLDSWCPVFNINGLNECYDSEEITINELCEALDVWEY